MSYQHTKETRAKLFSTIEDFYQSAGAAHPIEVINHLFYKYLQSQEYAETRPWRKDELAYTVSRLVNYISEGYEDWLSIKHHDKEFIELVHYRERKRSSWQEAIDEQLTFKNEEQLVPEINGEQIKKEKV